jgi:hypothetical protein
LSQEFIPLLRNNNKVYQLQSNDVNNNNQISTFCEEISQLSNVSKTPININHNQHNNHNDNRNGISNASESLWSTNQLDSNNNTLSPSPNSARTIQSDLFYSSMKKVDNTTTFNDMISNDYNLALLKQQKFSYLNQIEPISINANLDNDPISLNKYIQNSAFISSPVGCRNVNTKLNGDQLLNCITNLIAKNTSINNISQYSDYNMATSNLTKTHGRYNSNIDINLLNNYSKFNNLHLNTNDLFTTAQSPSCISPVNVNEFSSNNNSGQNSHVNTPTTGMFNSPRSFNNNTNHFYSPGCPSPVQYQQQQQQQQYFNANSIHHTWCGRLPPKIYSEGALYSRKVFLGGLPWDVNQQALLQSLNKYGSVKLEIPGKDSKHPRVSTMAKTQERSTPGYIYIIYEHESSVQRMLSDCRKDYKKGGEHYYYTIIIQNQAVMGRNQRIGYMTGKAKEIEVIPWNQDDTSYVPQNKMTVLPAKIDAKSTIFVGALHGMLNAHGLAKCMSEIFGDIIHAGLDTDKFKYPIGSGRVTFRSRQSYLKAIKAKYVTIKANLDPTDPSPKFEKTVSGCDFLIQFNSISFCFVVV